MPSPLLKNLYCTQNALLGGFERYRLVSTVRKMHRINNGSQAALISCFTLQIVNSEGVDRITFWMQMIASEKES
jgi:hypothetical protein